jgi:N-ethylmaleimide reductase
MPKPTLFDAFTLGPHQLKNRTVMAPMTRNRAEPGNVPGSLIALHYRQRASAGLIITEGSQVTPEGQGYPDTPGIHTQDQIDGWRRVTRAVHEEGGHIFLQLWHVGRISHSLYQPNRALPVAPSPIAARGQVFTREGMKSYEVPRALATEEVAEVVARYREGAKNALTAGFDGVEVHGANGYLIDQFLQDGSNRRTDRYGGEVENRTRFLVEVVQAVIEVWGPDRVGVRLSPNGSMNDMSDTNPAETFGHAVRALDALGVGYLHLRTGTAADVRHGRVPVPIATFRALFRGPLILNDGFDRERGETAIALGQADLVAFGTPFISNPDLPLRLRIGAPLTPPDPATFYGGGAKGYTDYSTLASRSEAA